MKKIGLLVLALVIIVASLGIAYATWNSDVTINGSVATGNVLVGIASSDATANYNGYGEVVAGSGWYNGMNEAIINAYPGASYTLTARLGNQGSLPVKFTANVDSVIDASGIIAGTAGADGSSYYTTYRATITKGSDVYGPYTGWAATNAKLGEITVGAGEEVDITINMTLSTNLPETAESKSATVTVTATGTLAY
jgi:hypothetical protein